MTVPAQPKLCVLCGIREATTADHVPPKNIFPKPRPGDLITVPACLKCNNEGSKHDEEFRVALSLQLGIEIEATQKLWKAGALRSLMHNQRLANALGRNSWEVDIRSPQGIYLGKRRAVAIPVRPHNAVLDRTVRGLYFHHFGDILGIRVSCKVTPISGIPREISPIVKMMSFASIGGEAFRYLFGRAADSPLDSMWILCFYKKYLVLVETRSKNRNTTIRPTGHP